MDQVIIDRLECTAVMALPRNHLSFVKDYLGVLYRGKDSTFLHMTSANYIEDQSAFYLYTLRIVIGWRNKGWKKNYLKEKNNAL